MIIGKHLKNRFVSSMICMVLLVLTVASGLVMDNPILVRADSLTLSVSYSQLQCGSPVTFTMNASGGSGNYKYMLNCMELWNSDYNGYYYVTDPSRLTGYSDSNMLDITFCASGTYRMQFYVMDMTTYSYTRKIVTLTINDASYPSVESLADGVVSQCRAAGNYSDYDTALWLHDWLVDNCSYDYSGMYCSAEGMLARGNGTCEAYHRAYEMLLKRAGISYGRMEGNGHVWTAVKMDGDWYQVDVTWDDNGYASKGSYENYLYFGIDDYIMNLVHSEHYVHSGYESNSLKNNYLYKSGTIDRWYNKFTSEITSNIASRQETFSMDVSDNIPQGYMDVIYNIVAYKIGVVDWNTDSVNVSLSASYDGSRINVVATYSDKNVSSGSGESDNREETTSGNVGSGTTGNREETTSSGNAGSGTSGSSGVTSSGNSGSGHTTIDKVTMDNFNNNIILAGPTGSLPTIVTGSGTVVDLPDVPDNVVVEEVRDDGSIKAVISVQGPYKDGLDSQITTEYRSPVKISEKDKNAKKILSSIYNGIVVKRLYLLIKGINKNAGR
ncbi:MAG: transglutaminase domain-containing protein [Eubacteriales bacterium]|nr:transglutaminase domain-containing protein [Eubacteriales bacterium]